MEYIDSERFLKHNHLERVPESDYLRLSDKDRERAYKDSVMRIEAVFLIIKYYGGEND